MNKIGKTINIYLIAEMQRREATNSFDYTTYIEDRKIKIIPNGTETVFTDVYLASEFVSADNIEEFIRIFGINLSANIELFGTENDDYHVSIDELGQIIISLDINYEDTNSYGEFIEVIENKDIDLVEDVESPSDSSEEATDIDYSSVTAEVLTEAELSDEEGPQWIVSYDLNAIHEALNEEEDAATNSSEIITAPDIETAVKYAEQNARIKAKDNPEWSDAEIISIKKKA